jgi:hypothetical protein
MARVTIRMMRNKIKDNEVASIKELIDVSLESGVGVASAFQEIVEADIELIGRRRSIV